MKIERNLTTVALAAAFLALGMSACSKPDQQTAESTSAMTSTQTGEQGEANEAGEMGEAGEGNEAQASAAAAALAKEAKVAESAARKTALAAVPGGNVEDFELEREGGKLIYSYDIKVAGKSGIDEVHIDAMTGRLLAKDHESPADEAKEAQADSGS